MDNQIELSSGISSDFNIDKLLNFSSLIDPNLNTSKSAASFASNNIQESNQILPFILNENNTTSKESVLTESIIYSNIDNNYVIDNVLNDKPLVDNKINEVKTMLEASVLFENRVPLNNANNDCAIISNTVSQPDHKIIELEKKLKQKEWEIRYLREKLSLSGKF